MFICQPLPLVGAVTGGQKTAVKEHCEAIKNDLKNVQKNDAKVRVNLGGLYETVLSKFIMPLNVRLVENNLSNAKLVENQNKFAEAKTVFADDYINYQQGLEELVSMDCKTEPGGFYEKLVKVRQRRKTMEQDVLKLRNLIADHIKLVTGVMEKV